MLLLFKGLKPFQLSEYIFLALFAFFIPMSWRIATYAMIGLFVCTILKGIFEEGFKINELQYRNKFAYFIFIAFWIIYAISFLYSENTAEARMQIGKKLSFLLFPLFFMTSNLSYLTKDRVRTVMYCFVIGILTLFVINLFWAGYDILFNEAEIIRLTSPHKFFKTDNLVFPPMHRAHFSLYTCMGLAFCFVEFINNNSLKLKIFNLLISIVLIISPFYVYSRAGILCSIVILFTLWIWITFVLKKRNTGIISCVIFLTSLIIGYFAFPKTIQKFTDAIENIQNGKGDSRVTIRNANRYVISENILFGVGSGDRNDETMNSYYRYKDDLISEIKSINPSDLTDNVVDDSDPTLYNEKYVAEVYEHIDSIIQKNEYDNSDVKEYLNEYRIIKYCIKHELNAHNQFSDTIIAVGVIGLILLLSFFIYPIILWIKNKNFDIVFFSLLLIIAFNSLFESVLERQMGIMFFVFFYFLLFHGNFCQQTTDNGQQTSSTIINE